jgi:hypothetical protein
MTHTIEGLTDSATYRWGLAGSKLITVTAVNAYGAVVSGTRRVTVESIMQPTYLPLVLRSHSE